LKTLKANKQLADVPVIMVSALGEKSMAYSLGAIEYLQKPIDWEHLGNTLKASLRKRRTDAKHKIVGT